MSSKSVCRLGDRCSGHACFPPRVNDEACDDVFANGIALHLEGHHWVTHCCGSACHDGVLAKGSPGVFVGGVPISRIGDPISCGSAVIEGSPNVFSG